LAIRTQMIAGEYFVAHAKNGSQIKEKERLWKITFSMSKSFRTIGLI